MTTHLSFTIGPVQGFVAQARRTRDLWCGSWMLSYLSEVALAAAENAGGQAIMPYRSDNDRGKVTSKTSSVGGIPNRFEMQLDSPDQAKQAAEAATAAFRTAWTPIADAVWKQYVEAAAPKGHQTKDIWDRQVQNFWELSWVAGTPHGGQKTIGHLSAARKNFRDVAAGAEGGVKCSLMADYQELSGHTHKKGQAAFWSSVQEKIGDLDLSDSERLCAVALIKRLFPRVSKQVVGNDLKNQNWPSTAFLAALPWLQSVERSPDAKAAAEAYAKAALDAGWTRSEQQAAKETGLSGHWASLDGPAWFADAVAQNEPNADREQVAELLKLLKAVQPDFKSDSLPEPSSPQSSSPQSNSPSKPGVRPLPYYALLLMDGDSMGKLLQKLNALELSKCLGNFTAGVDATVTEAKGRTVYAGGDDVMAILPATKALEVAAELARQYESSFERTQAKGIATLSGAIVYAHSKYPLRQILQHAHHLLDGVAKEATGRDALAIGIVQGSGLNAVWSAPWACIRQGHPSSSAAADSSGLWLQQILTQFGSNEKGGDKLPNFNASFLYHLREQFSRLFGQPLEEVGQFGQLDFGQPDQGDFGEVLTALANVEYRRRLGGKAKEFSTEDTERKLKPLMLLSQRMTRNVESHSHKIDPQTFGFDGWRVARFLKQLQEGKGGR